MSHYVEAVNTVIFNKSWTPLFKLLSDENAGKLIKALFDFMNGVRIDLDDEQLRAIFSCIADQIEHGARKYYLRVFREDENEE